MPEDQVKAGMHGVAYTVFEGVKPEPMDVEILGVLRDMAGPKSDVILARLHGKKVEYTGVVAGMSGSPVYIDGKLVGAIAYRIGEFSKEPIAGITPAASCWRSTAWTRPASEEFAGTGPRAHRQPAELPGLALRERPAQSVRRLCRPAQAHRHAAGLQRIQLKRLCSCFSKDFASAGVVPVMGAGSVSNDKQPEPLEPGSAVSAILVRGDMNIAGTCTVTYIDDIAPAGLRTSAAAIGQRRHADDQGDCAGNAAFAGELLQDRQYHRTSRRVCAGPSRRNHGTLRSRAAHDSGDADLPRRLRIPSSFTTKC